MSLPATLLTVAVLGLLAPAARAVGGWRSGRATFYGNEPWLWSIHEGSCGYGYIYKDEPLGWDVAAMADTHPDFAGSCGRCYEVQCDAMTMKDNFGNEMDRTSVCLNPGASVIVRTTDNCPCNYADNYYSNKRWCCGDMEHFDMSIWAFEKLADTKWGVMGIKFRSVPCDYTPELPAPPSANPFPGEEPPAGNVRQNRWGPATTADAPTPDEVPAKSGTEVVYRDGEPSAWTTSSYFAEVDQTQVGFKGGKAVCGKVFPAGAITFQAPKGRFDGKISLELWLKTAGGIPEVDVNLSGSGKDCRPVKIQDMNQSGQSDGWSRYDLYLGLFAPAAAPDTVVSFAAAFKGCGSAAAGDLERIEIKNNKPYTQTFCVDEVKLVAS